MQKDYKVREMQDAGHGVIVMHVTEDGLLDPALIPQKRLNLAIHYVMVMYGITDKEEAERLVWVLTQMQIEDESLGMWGTGEEDFWANVWAYYDYVAKEDIEEIKLHGPQLSLI